MRGASGPHPSAAHPEVEVIDGIRVECSGHGSPVLLLHGIGSAAVSMRDLAGRLATSHRVMAWDAPGYAGSSDPTAALGMDGYARAALHVARGIAQGPVHLVGVSWGGVIATRAAILEPDAVRSLVLIDSTRGSGVDPAKAEAMRARVRQLEQEGPERFAAIRAPALLSEGAPVTLVDEVRSTMAASIRLPGYGWAAESMAETDHTGLLGAVAAPALVIVGECDRVTPLQESRTIATSLPGARFEVVHGAGHLSNQEKPDEVASLVLGFLGELEAREDLREAAVPRPDASGAISAEDREERQ